MDDAKSTWYSIEEKSPSDGQHIIAKNGEYFRGGILTYHRTSGGIIETLVPDKRKEDEDGYMEFRENFAHWRPLPIGEKTMIEQGETCIHCRYFSFYESIYSCGSCGKETGLRPEGYCRRDGRGTIWEMSCDEWYGNTIDV